MSKRVHHIPDGYHAVTPYLIVQGAAQALEFYQKAFGAKELFRMPRPDGKIAHAEIKVGDSHVMLADEVPGMNVRGPHSLGGTSVQILLYVKDVDSTAAQAVAAGLKELRSIKDQFYGDRSGTFQDPFGHIWTIATHKEDVPGEEMARRAAKASGA